MPSFDITCGFDMQEMDNAVNMVKREIANRYDFRGTSSSITLNKSDNNIVIKGDIDYHLTAIIDMLQTKAISRKISIKTFKYGNVEKATGMSLRQTIDLISGLNKEESKNILTDISFSLESGAIEKTFVNKDPAGALKLGQARAAAIISMGEASLSVAEYSPNYIKKIAVGKGHATKEEVQRMISLQFPKIKIDRSDEADAIAIALCHLHSSKIEGALNKAIEKAM